MAKWGLHSALPTPGEAKVSLSSHTVLAHGTGVKEDNVQSVSVRRVGADSCGPGRAPRERPKPRAGKTCVRRLPGAGPSSACPLARSTHSHMGGTPWPTPLLLQGLVSPSVNLCFSLHFDLKRAPSLKKEGAKVTFFLEVKENIQMLGTLGDFPWCSSD